MCMLINWTPSLAVMEGDKMTTIMVSLEEIIMDDWPGGKNVKLVAKSNNSNYTIIYRPTFELMTLGQPR